MREGDVGSCPAVLLLPLLFSDCSFIGVLGNVAAKLAES